jgi:DNA-binding transcriptional MerR regulator
MSKSADAFRTISEVADFLDTPAHVLRFWESRFTQIKPVKRAGGRRYYRPSDVALIGWIKKLLHEDGLTIRGVRKILQQHGAKHVAAMAGFAFDEPLAAAQDDDIQMLADDPAPLLADEFDQSEEIDTDIDHADGEKLRLARCAVARSRQFERRAGARPRRPPA